MEATFHLNDWIPVIRVDTYGMLRYGVWSKGRVYYMDSAGNVQKALSPRPHPQALLPGFNTFRNSEMAQLMAAALEMIYVG